MFQGEVADGGPTGGIIFVEIQILRHAKACEEGPNLNLGRGIKVDGGHTLEGEEPKAGAKRTISFFFCLSKTRPVLQGRHALQLSLWGNDRFNLIHHFESMTGEILAIDEVDTKLLELMDAVMEVQEEERRN